MLAHWRGTENPPWALESHGSGFKSQFLHLYVVVEELSDLKNKQTEH